MWKFCEQQPSLWCGILLFVPLVPFKYVYTGNSLNMLTFFVWLIQIRKTLRWPRRTNCVVFMIKPKEVFVFAGCTTHSFSHLPRLYWMCTLYMCAFVCVAQRPLLFLPPTSHTQSVNPPCCLIPKKPTTLTQTHKRSSGANVTKVDSRKLHDGSLKSSRGSWWNTLKLPVIQPCRTERPKWPLGATATVPKLNVLLSVVQFSVVSLARSLSLLPSQPPYELYNKISPQPTIEALISISIGLYCPTDNIMTANICFIVLYKRNLLLLSSLPSSPAGPVVLSFSLLSVSSSALLH